MFNGSDLILVVVMGNRRFVYMYKLSDGSSGNWITGVIPPKAGYALAKRFPGRKVIMIKRMS